jgi:hypothetical protein
MIVLIKKRQFDARTNCVHSACLKRNCIGKFHAGRGAMLLEVVLALGLFVMTAVFVLDGMTSATRAVSRARMDSAAADLAITIMSEVEIGTILMVNAGPTDFEMIGYEGWTWEVVFNPLPNHVELTQLLECEVVIRHEEDDIVHRMSQVLWDHPDRGLGEESEEDLLQGLDPSALPAGIPGGGGLP